ncbi:MAG: hypothetical protein NTZ19_08455 [Bacteroidetes bacterium]|nr:hypothetical protein [Bacteroidota bacterium]
MISSTRVETTPIATQKEVSSNYSSLLLLPIAAVAIHQYSKRQMRGLERKMKWQMIKANLKSMLHFKKSSRKGSGLKLFLILLGIGFFVGFGLFLSWGSAIAFLLIWFFLMWVGGRGLGND